MSIYEPMSLPVPIEGVEKHSRALPRTALPIPDIPRLKGRVSSLLWKPESPSRRGLMFVAALAITAGYFFLVRSYEAPANTGVDQNAYLVGAKLFLKTGSTGLRPTDPYTRARHDDPFSFVGRMWFVDPDGVFYPKYPVGLAAIDAAIMKFTGGTDAVYLRSPAATALALLGLFLLARPIVGSFGGLMCMLVLGFSPITLQLADNPNSHATSLCLITWGFFFLVRWWQDRGYWRAALAGFLIGYATGVRYTEGLLGLPVLIACITNIDFKRLQSWAESFILGTFWSLPVALLFAYNLAHFGTLSGYDSTNESTGFSWPNFWANWEPMLRELYLTGLFFILPLGVAGIVMLLFKSWRIGLMLLTWAVPSILIYTAYYWDPPGQSVTQIGYMRFFETVLPPLIVGAFWVVSYAAAPLWRDPRMPGGTVDSICRWLLSLRCDPDSLVYAGLFQTLWLRTISIGGTVAAHVLRFFSPFLGSAQLAAIAVGGGALTLVSAGIGAYEVVGPVMQNVLYSNLGVAEATDMITREVHVDGHHDFNGAKEPAGIPKGSLVFVDNDNLLNDLQFVGDYTVYTNQAFTSASVQNFNMQVDNGQPMLFQIERTEMLKKEVGKLSVAQLLARQEELIVEHAKSGIRSFWIVPRTQYNASATAIGTFPNNARLRTRLVAIWTEQVPFPPMEVTVNNTGARGGGGGFGGGRGAGRGAAGGGRGARGGLGGVVAGGPGGGPPGGPGGFGGRGGGRGRGGGGLGIVTVQQIQETPAPPVIWQVIELIPPNAPAPQPILARPDGAPTQAGPRGGRGSYSNGIANTIAANPPSGPVNTGVNTRGGRMNTPPSVVTPVPVPPTVRPPPPPTPPAGRGAAARATGAAPATNRATVPSPARGPASPATAPATTRPQRPVGATTSPAGP